MADEKAPNAGVPTKKDRQAIASHSLLVIVKVKYEEWREERASKRRQAEAAKARAVLFPKAPSKPKADSKPKAQVSPLGDRLAKALIAALLLLMALLALLAWVWFLNHRPSIEATSLPLVGSSAPTAMATAVPAAVATDPVSSSEDVYLRVETLQLDPAYGIWRRMPNVLVFLFPYREGDAVPDSARKEYLGQVTEELLTADGFLVAATTFRVPPDLYWVWVDEASLPAGCSVWVPRFAADADSGISLAKAVVVDLGNYSGFNTTVVKFQIICGQEVSVSPTVANTQPPGPTSTPVSPTEPPPTEPSPTDPPPTDPPPPTPEPTEVDCNCETPEAPVPTPEFEATPTPTR